ncbi:universal stress protein [Gramella sp. AN32]|uniref:Universal stress protein n=1 Tax=Christiangramia antarctica TaxID=2058158 RepID=A0ABW5WZR2_9FLAO|nr:universal stress protein [Gramella sp. AN32]MCM4155692.1 universal stress protein [Gramella sp. AN32]
MEKKILIPTNFSKHSWNSLVFALKLYKKFPCTFYLINSYSSQKFFNETLPLAKADEDEQTEKEKSENGLERMMKGLIFRKENPKHQFEKISTEGNLVENVQDAVNKFGIDLIILGSQGDTAGISTSYDNQISKLTEKIQECPVLVIPETHEMSNEGGMEIVFPTNFKIPFKQRELRALIELAESLKASVRVLYINSESKPLAEKRETNKMELAKHLSDVHTTFHVLTQTTPTTGVHLFIEARDSNFLALYQRKKGFFSRLFSNPMTETINFDPKVPVLILKEYN